MVNADPSRQPPLGDPDLDDEIIDWREIFVRLGRGMSQTTGLAFLGLALGLIVYLLAIRTAPISTSLEVMFSFPGAEKGVYPDNSKFSPQDLISADVVLEALKHEGLDALPELLDTVQTGLSVEGIIPTDVAKQRDKLRSLGELPPPYNPDEFGVTLTLAKNFPLNRQQRGILLNEIVNAYRNKFERTYTKVPPNFGTAFAALRGVDFFEYDLLLRQELGTMIEYLRSKALEAKGFRSQTTNLSFDDLGDRAVIFKNVRLDDILGQIVTKGIARNSQAQLREIDYDLRNYKEEEDKENEDQKVVTQLLAQTMERSQNNVLAIKSEIGQQRPGSPILDQGLIDSLLANDTYNMLVRQVLANTPKLSDIEASEARLSEERNVVESFGKTTVAYQSAQIAQVDKSLAVLEIAYNQLISDIRSTNEDYIRSQFANAIEVTAQSTTEGILKKLAYSGVAGALLGLMIGLGLSLLGVYVGKSGKA